LFDRRRGSFSGFFSAHFTFIIFLVICIPCVSAQESITSIEVTGLKRTKPHIARYPLEQFLGQDAETLDFNDVMAAVKDTGVLEPVKVELEETAGGFILRVEVEEKWSFFPFPLVIGGSGGNTFGLFLADTNAFGIRDQAAVGAMYGSSGFLAVAFYNHTPNRKGMPGWTSLFIYNRHEREDADRNEKIHRRYSADELDFSFRLNYPFTDHITGSTGLSFSGTSLRESADALNQPEGALLIGFSPGFSLRYSSWDGYRLSQRSLSLGYTYNLAISGSSFHQGEFRGIYEQSFIPGFRINLQSGGVWKFSADGDLNPLYEEGPHRAQVDILPRKSSARQYAGFSAGLEKYLVKIKWGTLSVRGSWQCVIAQGPLSDEEAEFSHGPSGGLSFYLSRLAIPALGIGLAYNVSTGIYQFSFNIGTGF
jgi:hypothetical protein